MSWKGLSSYDMVMVSTRQRTFLILALAVIVCFVTFWTITSRYQLHQVFCPPNDAIIDKDILLDTLHNLQNILKRENDSQAAWEETKKLLQIITGVDVEDDPSNDLPTVSKNESMTQPVSKSLLEVCPEEWMGPKVDHPFFFNSWKILNCSNVLPFEKVLTIILQSPSPAAKTCSLQHVLEGIKRFYPKITVLVSGVSNNCNSSQMKWIADAKDANPGKVWNKLIEQVTTPYVLVGRDLDDFLWTTQLERQVRMISYNRDISVAGGAVRNSTGHWRVGCWQTKMYNYILEYQNGYYTSMNSSLFCGHLTGPFVVRTKVVKDIKFDDSLRSDVLFEDWFWRIKEDSHKVVNCPDVMYLASDATAYNKTVNRTPWIPLVRKWGLNRVVIPRGRTFSYTCSEAGLSCSGIGSLTNSFLMPICCVEQFGKAIGVFNDFCRKHNLRYEIESGSALGAVKMNDLMPWDLDGDIAFYALNMSFFKSNSDHFKKYGMVLKQYEDRGKDKNYFKIYTPDLYSEMWGEKVLSHDMPLGKPFRVIPTQVELHGHWVYATHNPGSYARNRYGMEVYRHAHSWLQLGMSTSWVPYESGHFKKCKKPKHHACLDHFSADGNLQFQIPN